MRRPLLFRPLPNLGLKFRAPVFLQGLFFWIFFFSTISAWADISPSQIVKWVHENNNVVRLAHKNWKMSAVDSRFSDYEFDWNLTLSWGIEENTELAAFSFQDDLWQENISNYSLSLDHKFVLGTDITLSFQHLKVESDGTHIILPSRHQGALVLELNQPLLKGVFPRANNNATRKASIKEKRFAYKWEKALREQIVKALSGYVKWQELAFREKYLKEARESAKLVRDQVRSFFKEGKKSKRELLGAKSLLKMAEAEYLINQQDQLIEKNKLEQLVFRSIERRLPSKMVFSDLERWLDGFSNFDTELSMNEKIVDLKLQEIGEDLFLARANTWPQLDLNFSWTNSALSLERNKILGQLVDSDFPSWQLGLVLNIPLGGYGADGAYRSSMAKKVQQNFKKAREKRRQTVELDRLKNSIAKNSQILKSILKRDSIEEERFLAKKKFFKNGQLSIRDMNESLKAFVDFKKTLSRTRQEHTIDRIKRVFQWTEAWKSSQALRASLTSK